MNKTLVKVHTWLALVLAVPLLLICLTGSLLVFKHEIDALLIADRVAVDAAGERRSLDNLLEAVNARFDRYEVVGWTLFADPQRADVVFLMARGSQAWSYTFLNPYSGAVLADAYPLGHYLTDWLLDLHATLLLDHAGLLLASLVSTVLCLLGISGLVIYRKFWKRFFTLRWNSRMTVFFTDLHKMVGVVFTPVFLLVGITGAYWNIVHFVHEEFEHTAAHASFVMAERMYSDTVSLETLSARAAARIDGFVPRYISFPHEPDGPMTFFGQVPTGNILLSQYASYVTFSPFKGELLSAADIRDAGLWTKTVDSFRHLHFGTFGGLFTRILWCLAGLAPLVLAITGISVWYRRRSRRSLARRERGLKRRLA
ncbi:PepSY domain-containing protein [Exilibacterium tricleocarpae]|uniref:PepSY domain-containing protein n=1 Tax=Exilibacterium tricleocarpae TaxID=2591008 RepID=A0A545U5H8_9GAMM|nr:PepSY-associated TM helix domain-containing protein [Exilibacterium tricleocarpae]TQV84721.1 PepSY domain-containing protein [Exilibacterium tricleocarpae]